MTQDLTVIMYHYVRDLPHTRYPTIKGLLVSQFMEQLRFLRKNYTFVSVDQCLAALYQGETLPPNACLLTFDDGYIDHFVTVFPILQENKIQGCFFIPAKPILHHEVLDVNKIHFVIAAASDSGRLLVDVYACLDKYRSQYQLEGNQSYYSRLAVKNRFDSPEVVFIKRLLQRELEEEVRKLMIDELFQKYVTKDENSFARELYLDTDQIKCMAANGMYIGSHGYDHYWLDRLSPQKQRSEIEEALKFLSRVNAPTENWGMCYPYGAYNDSLIAVLKESGCLFAFTTKVDKARLSRENAYTLERLDTNDFVK